jgi:hypothetical protein
MMRILMVFLISGSAPRTLVTALSGMVASLFNAAPDAASFRVADIGLVG